MLPPTQAPCTTHTRKYPAHEQHALAYTIAY